VKGCQDECALVVAAVASAVENSADGVKLTPQRSGIIPAPKRIFSGFALDSDRVGIYFLIHLSQRAGKTSQQLSLG
jgi:hypothetical protein